MKHKRKLSLFKSVERNSNPDILIENHPRKSAKKEEDGDIVIGGDEVIESGEKPKPRKP